MEGKDYSNEMLGVTLSDEASDIIPTDELPVDFSNTVVTEITDNSVDLTLVIPEDERIETQEAGQDDFAEAKAMGCFSQVKNTYGMETESGHKIYAYIDVTSKGKRFIKYCQQYSNGEFSPYMEIAQEDLIMASRFKFIEDKAPIGKIRNNVSSFVLNVLKDYSGKILYPREAVDIILLLNILVNNYSRLPVHDYISKETPETIYKTLVQVIKERWDFVDEHKAYYTIDENQITEIADKMGMKKLQLLKKLKMYGFLYTSPSAKGYKNYVRFKPDGDFLKQPQFEWTYCILKLDVLAKLMEQKKQKEQG